MKKKIKQVLQNEPVLIRQISGLVISVLVVLGGLNAVKLSDDQLAMLTENMPSIISGVFVVGW